MNDHTDKSVDEILSESLRSSKTQNTLAVASKRSNDLADTELATDLREMTGTELAFKYGEEVANNRWRLSQGQERLNRSDDASGDGLKDLAVSASTGAYRNLGQVGILADSYARSWLNPEGGSGAERATPLMEAHAEVVAGMQKRNLSEELQIKREFEGIEAVLDEQDSQSQYEREVADGERESVASWRREGRNFLSAGQRYLRDSTLLSNTVVESVGDMIVTAPLAGAGGKLAIEMTKKVTQKALAQRVAGTLAVSAISGAPELGNVYSETVTDIMGIETEKLLATSPVMQAMLAEDSDMTPEEAKVQLAGLAAEVALVRQIPSNLAIGFITSRFEALGPLAFKGKGVGSNLLQIAGEGVEEALQEGSSVYNRNISVEQMAQIGRDHMSGIGTGAGVGFVAGVGSAGAMGAPSITAGVAVNAANALFAETAPGEGSRAGRAANATGRALTPVAQATGRAIAPVGRAASAAVNETLNRIDDSTDNKEVKENVQTIINVTEALRTEADNGTIDPRVTEVIDAPDLREASEGFTDVAGGGRNLVESLTGVMAKIGSRRFKPSGKDFVYAADMVNRLESIVGSLPQDQQKSIGKLLSTKMVKNIRKKAAEVDLNAKDADTSTPNVINVARTNPGNMNPDIGNNLLEDNESEMSPEDAKYVRVSTRLGEIVNRNLEVQAELQEKENIALKPGSRPKPGSEKTARSVSRQIHLEGRAEGDGKRGYRSINDFGRDLVLAAQAVAQTGIFPKDAGVINQEGRVVPAGQIATEMANFAQHMVNKVNALKESASKLTIADNGREVAPIVEFMALQNGSMQTTGNKSKIRGVWLAPNNPKSMATAKQIEQDANDMIDAYNLMLAEFPEFFDTNAKPMENVSLDVEPVADSKPTGIDEDSSADGSEEQNQNTGEVTPDPTKIVDDELPGDFNVPEGATITAGEPQTLQQDIDNPTAVEEDGESRSDELSDEASDERSESEPEEGNEEGGESLSDEQEYKKVYELLTTPEMWPEGPRKRLDEQKTAFRRAARSLIKEYFGNKLARREKGIVMYPAEVLNDAGMADDESNQIFLSDELWDAEKQELTRLGKAVVIHEMAHIIDFSEKSFGDVDREISARVSFDQDGAITAEFELLKDRGDWVRGRYDYAVGQDSDTQRRREIFAIISELWFSKDPSLLDGMNKAKELMEEVYGPRERNTVGTPAESTEVSEGDAIDVPSTTEEPGDGTPEEAQVSPAADENFPTKGGEAPVKGIDDLAAREGMNQEHITVARELKAEIGRRLNARLQRKVKNSGKVATFAEHFLSGKFFKQFKMIALMNPETQAYDNQVIEMATIAIVDFITSAAAIDPRKLKDTLEDRGLTINDVEESNLQAILNGLPASQVKDQLASDFMRLMNRSENKDSPVNELEGLAQGFAAEMITIMNEMGIVSVDKISVVDSSNPNADEALTVTVTSDKLTQLQQRIRQAGGEGVTNTVRELIFGDTRASYSIGEKIPNVAVKGERSDVRLSRMIQKALKKMQDTGHRANENRGNILGFLGEVGLEKWLGYVPDAPGIKHPILRKSALGKNATVRLNILEVNEMMAALGDNIHALIYYPVGITKVGRHQYQGPNPQANKLLRFFASPTWATIDLENQKDMDGFWLGVAQASGLFKVEKKNRKDVLSKVQAAFDAEFRDAVEMTKAILTDGEVDVDAYIASIKSDDPAVLGAIEAVATMEMARQNNSATFETNLSFELDGLTNGAANMMVNFGHGLIAAEEWENFNRIGMFLGKIGRTTNDYFGSGKTTDLYEQVAKRADDLIAEGGGGLKKWQKDQRSAAMRMAWAFSDNEKVEGRNGEIEYRMTRNSAKNPMTKVNYGSGVKGVALGIAADMLLDFYEKSQQMGDDQSYEDFFYPEIREDFKRMGLTLPAKPNKNWVFASDQVDKFNTRVQFTIGDALTNATREVLGSRIEQLNDMLVLVTNIQNKYVQARYEEEITKAVKEAGVRSPAQLPRATFERIQKEMYQLTPIFRSDDQTLAIGGFDKKLTDMRVSSNMDEEIRTPARMPLPDDIGVKALPFMIIGSGDAMMMNFFFGSDNAPEDVLGIFDGLDVPVTKIEEYSPQINEAVSKSWSRDVLGMAIANFDSFLDRVDDPALFEKTSAEVLAEFKKPTVQTTNWKDLREQLKTRYKENKARKKIIDQVQRSIDQMGGGGVGFSHEGENWNRTEINIRIENELKDKKSDVNNGPNVSTPVTISDVKTVLKVTKWTANQKQTVNILKPLLGDTRVIFGTLDQLNAWKWENMPDDGSVLRARGTYDAKNDIIYITTKSNETILHEMVHAATFGKVLDHYEGNTNPAVQRLEDLARQFIDIESDNKAVLRAQAVMNRRFLKNKPHEKASAINEFMAYALSNEGVRRTLEGETASIMQKITDQVKKLMRRIMGGVRQDMFSHTVFNTRVLFGNNDGDNGGGGVIVPGDGNNGSNDGGGNGGLPQTDDPFHNFTNYWIETLRNWISDEASDEQTQRTSLELANAQRVIDSLRQDGFLRNTRDQATFKAIYGIMLSEMKLNAQSRIGLTRVFQHILDTMNPEMFGEGTEANNAYSAVVNVLSDEDASPGHAVAVLFGLSQTSEQIKAMMNQIPQPTGEAAIEGTLNVFMQKITAFTMQKLTASLNDQKPPKDVLDLIAATIVDHDVAQEYRVLSHITSNLEAADNFLSGQLSIFSEFMRGRNDDIQNSTRNTAIKLIMGTITVGGTNLLSREGAALTGEASKRFVNQFEGWYSIIPFQELVTEMVGTDRQNEHVTVLLDKINSAISGMRQAYREDLPGILERLFQEAPSKYQWKSMFNTLAKTDFASIVDTNNMQNSMKIMEERSTRETMLNNIENELRTKLNQSNADDAIEKGEQLANYMVHGTVGKMLMHNAYAIMNGLEGSIPEEVEGLLNRWISIKAIDVMDPSTREDVIQLWQNDPNAITAIVTYLQQLNKQEDAKTTTNQARLNGRKGYIPNEGQKNMQIVVALDESELEMNRKGFKKLNIPYTGDASSVFPKSYYVSNVRRQGAYSQGAMQNVAMTYRGVDINTGLAVTGDTAGYISNEDGLVNGLIKDQLKDSTTLKNEQENIMPVHAEDGTIQGFELSISHDVMNKHAGRDENLAVMMGAWAGRQVEESLASNYNRTLADELKKIWDQREAGSESTFVDFKESKDPIHRDTWSLVPQDTKVYLEAIFGNDGIQIPRSMINLSLGYREPSVADAWSGKSRLPENMQKAIRVTTERIMGRNAMRWLSGGEEVFQGIVSTAKDIIVVRSLIVPAMNARSNAIQLANAGVPHKTMVKGFRAKLAEIEEYNNNAVKVKELQAQLLLAGNNKQRRQIVEDKIRVIEDLNKKMSIAPMIEAGAYKQLSEGITDLDVAITSGKLGDYMEKLADKLPVGGAVMKVGMVSKTTDLYKAANRATQYGDFLAKSILYDHLLGKGLVESQALTQVNEEFVNFTPLPGRTRSYLESVGLLWFPAFKLRIAKIAMKQLRENPVRSMALNFGLPDIGSPIQDNIFQVMIEGRLDYATGLEMLFAAPELNPWYNLMLD